MSTLLQQLQNEFASAMGRSLKSKKRKRVISKPSVGSNSGRGKPKHKAKSSVENRAAALIAEFSARCPRQEDCMFRLITTRGLTIKRLFEAVRHIVLEARLIAKPDTLCLINQQDSSKLMYVEFSLSVAQLVKSGEYHVEGDSFFIPLDLDRFVRVCRNIRANDMVAIAVTKRSVKAFAPTIQMWVKEPVKNGDCYSYSIPFLNKEQHAFGLPNLPLMACESHSVMLKSSHFKRLLLNVAVATMKLEFGPTTTSFLPQGDKTMDMRMEVWSAPAPCGKCMGCAENQPNQQAHMEEGGCLRLEDENNSRRADCDPIVTTFAYEVLKLMRVTKATKLSPLVTLTYAPSYPLLVDYSVGDWGSLFYRLYTEEDGHDENV